MSYSKARLGSFALVIALILARPTVWAEESLKDLNDKNLQLQSQGNYAEAVRVGEVALRRARKQYGKNNAEYGVWLSNVGEAYRGLGDKKRARSLLTEAVDRMRKARAESDARFPSILHGMGTFYLDSGDHNKALATFKEQLELEKRIHGEDSHEYGQTLSWIGWTYKAKGDYRRHGRCPLRVPRRAQPRSPPIQLPCPYT